ncbi:Tyrosine aminotransferase [Vitis vinifera]|uniref:Tyrosine aminotransferase n=1 Tax=Vitis vinifera TaxID=29760 RepID=A0A438JKI3_VITVI|nr:Tyrosine aminotransferase [Vitis vinifera]
MENGAAERWGFRGNQVLHKASSITVRGVLGKVISNLNPQDRRPVITLGQGDPSAFSSFRTSPEAEEAIVDAVRSRKFNSYSPDVGVLTVRRAIAEYLSADLPYKLSPDDVYLTIGCAQAIKLIIKVLALPGANILLPRPGYALYEAHAAANHLEFRRFDLLPEKGWEVDLEGVKALADENTVAMVIINPGNPCGNVFTHQHLKKVAETARMLGILVIADEVYGHLVFGSNPYVPMGVFGSITPVITLGSISKRWIVPGWRLGWLVTNDPNGILCKSGVLPLFPDHPNLLLSQNFSFVHVVETIVSSLNICTDPATFIQGAVPQIIEKTTDDFFSRIIGLLRKTADICFDGLADIPALLAHTSQKEPLPLQVNLNVSLLEDIEDDMDFCVKLSKEESVIILPGFTVGMKNWLRITFATESPSLEDGLGRIKAFCQRHAKKQ